jgi:Sulfotransferase family
MNAKLNQIQKLLEQNKLSKASELLKKFNKNTKQVSYRTLDWEAYCYSKNENWQLAINRWSRAFKLSENNSQQIEVLLKISEAEHHINDLAAAKQTLKRSLSIDSSVSNLASRLRVCEISLKLEDHETVEYYAPKLLSYESSHMLGMVILAKSAYMKGDKDLLVDRLMLFQKHAGQLGVEEICFVTDLFLRVNETTLARAFLDLIDKNQWDEPWFKVFEALIALGKKDYYEVIRKLESLQLSSLPGWLQEGAVVNVSLAKSYDKLGNFSKAFQQYQYINEQSRVRLNNFKRYDALPFYKNIELSSLKKVDSETQPVFMLGFPRSGTTLLETILDSEESIGTLSEPDTITHLAKLAASETYSKGYVQALPKLKVSQIEEYQEKYLSLAEQYLPDAQGKQVIVDKMPLYSIYLPFINMLFPRAKYIINIRHPLDVVLSNFQQNFQLNDQMSFFVSLTGCVERYIEVMTFLEKMKADLSIEFIEVRYEDLVADIHAETERLFKFLGVKYTKNVEEFHLHANRKVINTASKAQVTEPLYSGSVYKWKNYEQYLAPYIPQLQPLIELYGYK